MKTLGYMKVVCPFTSDDIGDKDSSVTSNILCITNTYKTGNRNTLEERICFRKSED